MNSSGYIPIPFSPNRLSSLNLRFMSTCTSISGYGFVAMLSHDALFNWNIVQPLGMVVNIEIHLGCLLKELNNYTIPSIRKQH